MQQRESGLIVPNAWDRAIITPRNAPKPRIGAGVGGWIEWELVDRRGRAVAGGQQHNLFLNQGLDAVAAANQPIYWSGWFGQLSVGTDSTEPDPTDTALGSLAATTSTIVNTPVWTRPSAGVYERAIVFEVDFEAGNGNLTEWGVRFGQSPNTLLTRELFRDIEGDPVTIVKTSDFKLRVAYTFQLELSPVTLTAGSFDVTGVGTLNGDYMFRGGAAVDQQRDLHAFGGIAAGQTSSTSGGFFLSSTVDSGVYSDGSGPSATTTSSLRATTQTPSTYTSGSYTRTATGFWGTSNGNTTIATVCVSGDAGTPTLRGSGFVFVIDEGDRFTKDDEHTLTIDDLCTVTWAAGT